MGGCTSWVDEENQGFKEEEVHKGFYEKFEGKSDEQEDINGVLEATRILECKDCYYYFEW